MKHIAHAAVLVMATAASAQAATIIDGTTAGLYNAGLGTLLDGAPAGFPLSGTPADPTISYGPGDEPDLSNAAAQLGAWLSTPAAPGGTWSASPVAIPSTWAVEDETAIIYAFDAGPTGLTNIDLSIGVDNGVFVWLNGVFQGGAMAPGVATLGEFTLDLGSVGAGTNYLQVLREDHGGGTGYAISVTADAAPVVPLPASLPLLLAGLGVFGWMKRRAA